MSIVCITQVYAVVTATGNITTTDGNYTVIQFLSNGSFNTTGNLNVTVLVVAGGGGGGINTGGGGGGGGLLYNQTFLTNGSQGYPVVVGVGGGPNITGANSSFAYMMTLGGGGGGVNAVTVGKPGGSGGGGCYNSNPGAGLTGQGFGGGKGAGASAPYNAGGGGGAGGVGENGTASKAGDGGIGKNYSINGSNVYYAGGGGAGSYSGRQGLALQGGGGDGTNNSLGAVAFNGTNGLGGGGGGSGAGGTYPGGYGGSGVVIIRYLTTDAAENTITYSSATPVNNTYKDVNYNTLNTTPLIQFNVTNIFGTYVVSFIDNGTRKNNVTVNAIGSYNLTVSPLDAGEHYWWLAAESVGFATVNTSKNYFYIPGNVTVTNGTSSCVTNLGNAYFRPNNCGVFP